MALPAIELLERAGFSPALVGRRWVPELFEPGRWPALGLSAQRGERLRQLRGLRRANEWSRDVLLLTNSFSTAFETRVVGLQPSGYATDGRRLFLRRAIKVPAQWAGNMHTVDYYYYLVQEYLKRKHEAPPMPQLRVGEAARARARAALSAAGVGGDYVVLCPVAQGRHRGYIKCWSEFGRLGRNLAERGLRVILCPGPGERDSAAAAVPTATVIDELDLGAFAALLADSRLVVANDSGPGHLAAAVGANLVSVFGVTDPSKTRPRGAHARLVGGKGGWPAYEEVEGAVTEALKEASAAPTLAAS